MNKFLENMRVGLSLLDKSSEIHSHFATSNPQKQERKPPEKLLDMESTKKLV